MNSSNVPGENVRQTFIDKLGEIRDLAGEEGETATASVLTVLRAALMSGDDQQLSDLCVGFSKQQLGNLSIKDSKVNRPLLDSLGEIRSEAEESGERGIAVVLTTLRASLMSGDEGLLRDQCLDFAKRALQTIKPGVEGLN